MSRIFHVDLYGTRKHKYETLRASDMASLDWQEIDPNKPFYLFRPQEQALRKEYEQGWSVVNIFPINSIGIVTARDSLTIHFTEGEVRSTVLNFQNLPPEEARSKYSLGDDTRDWQVTLAQQDLRKSPGQYSAILYRPYDIRQTYYTGLTRGFQCMPRAEVMKHMVAGDNLGIITTRATKDDFDCSVSNTLMGHKAMAAYDVNYLFPLWLYPEQGTLEAAEGRRANLNPKFVEALAERLGGETPTPEAIFFYAYAVFHAPTYRERYAPFLKIDFPRLPLPPQDESGDGGASAGDTFHALAKLGERLVALHLLESPELAQHGVKFPVSGDHTVKKMRVGDRYQQPTTNNQAGFGSTTWNTSTTCRPKHGSFASAAISPPPSGWTTGQDALSRPTTSPTIGA